jgi:hypothetical protein
MAAQSPWVLLGLPSAVLSLTSISSSRKSYRAAKPQGYFDFILVYANACSVLYEVVLELGSVVSSIDVTPL